MGHTNPVYGKYGVVGAKLLIGSKDAVFLREIQVFRYVIRAEEMRILVVRIVVVVAFIALYMVSIFKSVIMIVTRSVSL